jgi:DNA (cytosine-5)-methyltransferase 1
MAVKKDKSRQRSVSHAKCETPGRIVLVGTYKGDQLTDWRGWYNYPISDEDKITDAEAAKITELWLFKGTKAERRYKAEFVGVKTRDELIRDYGYPAKGKAHGEKYLLFKAAYMYRHKADVPEEAQRVIVRTKDFARSPKIRKQLKAYLESPDRNDPDLAKCLPEIITKLRPDQLRVCEAAVQMSFLPMLINPAKCNFPVFNGGRPIAVDLFAGCGGLSLGFEQAGFDIVAAVEIDPIHAAVHEYNFPRCKTICADIKNISGKDICRLAHIENREVDIVFGGAPCQGFSMIGKRALDDPRNQLIGHYLRVVSDIRPKYCVLENVKGLTVGKHAQFLSELIDELKKIHYKVLLPYRVLNAADYGVPQNRERLFLIAAREDQKLPVYPQPQKERVTIGDAISDIPDADMYEDLLSDDSVPVKWETKREYAKQLRGLCQDETNYGYERRFDKDRLTASWRTIHGAISKDRFLAAPQGETEPHSRFFKLSWDGQSNTLRAGTDSARGGFTSPRPIHPTLPRVITVREAARIHSYPDWFRFNKTKWHGFREIGNSVPPRLARAVGSMILTALGLKPSKPKITLETGDESLLEFDMRSAAEYFGVPRTVIAQRKRKNDGEKHKET